MGPNNVFIGSKNQSQLLIWRSDNYDFDEKNDIFIISPNFGKIFRLN